jgi:acyl-CoA reductase-like NAD-dependent aldehyde dehydrogenase
MGTVISPKHLERIGTMIAKSKGRVVIGGSRLVGRSQLDNYDLAQGSFFAPTIVADVGLDDELWREEVFGPVVVVQKFRVSFNCIS